MSRTTQVLKKSALLHHCECGGYALLCTGAWLSFLVMVAAYQQNGISGVSAELNPLNPWAYAKLAYMMPGLGLLFAARQSSGQPTTRSNPS